jgi:hypothetical protein
MRDATKPEEFWAAFILRLTTALREHPDWHDRFASDSDWTAVMKEVLQRTGYELGFREQNAIGREYLRLDMAFYSFPDRPADTSDVSWDLEVAIEHENNSEAWFDEWVKLCHIASGLKVLITYHDYREGRTSIDAKLDAALRLYRKVRYKPADGTWLLIFGPTSSRPQNAWLGYTFDGEAFHRQFEATGVLETQP